MAYTIEGNILIYLLHVKWSNFLNTSKSKHREIFRVVTTWIENSVCEICESTEKSVKFIHHG